MSEQDKSSQCPDCDISKFTTFGGGHVKRLSSADFTLDSQTLIGIKYEDCMICLFHVENEESMRWIKIWKNVASQVAGPVFAACNVLLEEQVARAFTKVKMDGNHPFHAYGLNGWPVIIAFRGGYPAAVYNSEVASQPLTDWATTSACNAGYFEPIQIYGSVQLDKPLEAETPIPFFGENKNRKTSLDYKVDNPVRSTKSGSPVVVGGTQEEKEAAVRRRKEEAEQLGVNLTEEESRTGILPPERKQEEAEKPKVASQQ